ncbi:MAG: RNA polymerase sigma factor [Acidobacteria bacterium]|nr:RNA polymerase sigma factor [Acidobacteriota bacterium]
MIEQEYGDKSISASSAHAQSLIAQAKLGDTQAFEQLLIRYQRQVLGTAIRLLGNIDDAQDAAQEVFLRLHKYLYKFDEEKEFLPWLYQVTTNTCRDIARKRARASTVSLEQEQANGKLDNIASKEDIEIELNISQEKKIISDALESLSERERTAIVLRDIQGLETKDVARILGTAEATIRSQISMARIKIKKYRDKILNKLI